MLKKKSWIGKCTTTRTVNNAKMNKKGNTKSNTELTPQAVEFNNEQLYDSDFFLFLASEVYSAYTNPIFHYYQYFLACTKGDIQRPQNPSAGCCATDLTSAMPAASWFDCFLLCEKRQRKHQDCEYFEFMNNDYAGMAEQRVDKTPPKN